MYLKHLASKQIIKKLLKLNGESLSPRFNCHRNLANVTGPLLPFTSSPKSDDFTLLENPKNQEFVLSFKRYIYSTQKTNQIGSTINQKTDSEEEEDEDMSEFLSRFVWIMRGKISKAYPDADKQTIYAMLLIIVRKVVSEIEKGSTERMLGLAAASPSQDFSEDLWKTAWEVSNSVLEDMEKVRKKEKMKGFLQSEEVKEMCRFAGEIGIRGDMSRELRFKWAREKLEESDFYESLERLRVEAQAQGKTDGKDTEEVAEVEEKSKVVTLPKRHGKIRYKIYGLDLSDPKWTEVADKIYERGEIVWPEEPKPISGKCKLVVDKILSLKEEEDPSPLLDEWKDLLQPTRMDWINLLDRLQGQNTQLYFKVAELLLSEKSFQTNICDYSKLIDTHAKKNHLDDAEQILKKMNENGIHHDILTASVLVHMYSKAGNLARAEETFKSLSSHGFQPEMKLYNSMIMAYVNDGQPDLGESLMREMEARDIKPSQEIFLALLQSYAQHGDVSGAQRIVNTMQYLGFQPTLESCNLLVETYGQAGNPDLARSNFDYMIKLGYKPDDRSTASMINAYQKKNLLDKALNLLLQLERDGFEPGSVTYTVFVDWLCKMQLIDEAEQLLGKISKQGEAPPFKIQVSLCEMYARARSEKKAFQALGVLEAKQDHMGRDEFERIIDGLRAGEFLQDAQRLLGVMEARGFTALEPLKVAVPASQTFNRKRP